MLLNICQMKSYIVPVEKDFEGGKCLICGGRTEQRTNNVLVFKLTAFRDLLEQVLKNGESIWRANSINETKKSLGIFVCDSRCMLLNICQMKSYIVQVFLGILHDIYQQFPLACNLLALLLLQTILQYLFTLFCSNIFNFFVVLWNMAFNNQAIIEHNLCLQC